MSLPPRRQCCEERNRFRIIIFRAGALGDFILTLPAIAALRRSRPGAFIEVVAHPQYADLAVKAGLIDKVRSLDSASMAVFFQSQAELPSAEIEYIRSFDLVISFLHDPDGVLFSQFKNAGAKNIIAVSPIVKKGHAADHFLEAIKDVGGVEFIQPFARSHFVKCENASTLPLEQLPSRQTDLKGSHQILLKWPPFLKAEARRRFGAQIGSRQIIVIHPGSGSPAKNWPAEKFALLAQKIKAETNFTPVILGGEADTRPVAVMRSLLPGFHFLENLSLEDAAALLSVAAGFVGNDSGITHLAAALGIPVVALFGPTDPALWAPHGKNVRILQRGALAEIDVGCVLEALAGKLRGG